MYKARLVLGSSTCVINPRGDSGPFCELRELRLRGAEETAQDLATGQWLSRVPVSKSDAPSVAQLCFLKGEAYRAGAMRGDGGDLSREGPELIVRVTLDVCFPREDHGQVNRQPRQDCLCSPAQGLLS